MCILQCFIHGQGLFVAAHYFPVKLILKLIRMMGVLHNISVIRVRQEKNLDTTQVTRSENKDT